MELYEIMLILRPDLETEEFEEALSGLSSAITTNEGTVSTVLDWHKRRLAYEIEKHKDGHYYLIYFSGPGTIIPEIEHYFRVTDAVIRYMIVRSDEQEFEAAANKAAAEPVEVVEEIESAEKADKAETELPAEAEEAVEVEEAVKAEETEEPVETEETAKAPVKAEEAVEAEESGEPVQAEEAVVEEPAKVKKPVKAKTPVKAKKPAKTVEPTETDSAPAEQENTDEPAEEETKKED